MRQPFSSIRQATSSANHSAFRAVPEAVEVEENINSHRPRAADKQFVPPDPEPPKNPDPALIVEPTVVAPQIAQLRSFTVLNIGDPNGVIGPPSSGPGNGGGIGDGDGRGVGPGKGPGVGPGEDGGIGGNHFGGGGGMTAPTLIYRIDPEYSEEARKARFQGTVIL